MVPSLKLIRTFAYFGVGFVVPRLDLNQLGLLHNVILKPPANQMDKGPPNGWPLFISLVIQIDSETRHPHIPWFRFTPQIPRYQHYSSINNLGRIIN